MDYDKGKVDEVTLALLYLGLSRIQGGGRAWKAFDMQTLDRLYQKGWIAKPKVKEISVAVTEAGVKKSEELFQLYFQRK